MEDFLRFKRMITPVIIQIVFWIGVVLCVLSGFVQIVMGVGGHEGGARVLLGLLTILLGPIAVRIYCEILIVLFSINDTLTDIKNKMRDTVG
jgi:hypothetical protein